MRSCKRLFTSGDRELGFSGKPKSGVPSGGHWTGQWMRRGETKGFISLEAAICLASRFRWKAWSLRGQSWNEEKQQSPPQIVDEIGDVRILKQPEVLQKSGSVCCAPFCRLLQVKLPVLLLSYLSSATIRRALFVKTLAKLSAAAPGLTPTLSLAGSLHHIVGVLLRDMHSGPNTARRDWVPRATSTRLTFSPRHANPAAGNRDVTEPRGKGSGK